LRRTDHSDTPRNFFFDASEIITPKSKRPAPTGCEACGLDKDVITPRMEPHGRGRLGILIVGEAPGEKEDQLGRPSADPEPCVVLDPYAGTGTTLAVAESMGMISVGIELNPKYVEMIRQRILYGNVGSGKDIISGKKFF